MQVYWDAEGRQTIAHKDPGALFWADWSTWLKVSTDRLLNDMVKAHRLDVTASGHIGAGGPSVDMLTAAYVEILEAHAPINQDPNERKPVGFKSKEVQQRLASTLAAFVHETWTSEYIEGRIEAGRKGGRASKRGPASTYAQFLALPRGMSKREQAKALGVQPSTIGNYRARRAAERA